MPVLLRVATIFLATIPDLPIPETITRPRLRTIKSVIRTKLSSIRSISPSTPSAYGPDLECYEGGDTHPCFDGTTAEFYIAGAGAVQDPERTYLSSQSITYLAIDRSTLHATYQDAAPNPEAFYSFQCNVYPIAVLLHGQDDPREAWANPLSRSMGWKYRA